MTLNYFILQDRKVVPAKFQDWQHWIETVEPESLVVDQTVIEPDIDVSTVFTSIDMRPQQYIEPKIFKTLVTGGDLDGVLKFYSTLQGAIEGHTRIIEVINQCRSYPEMMKNELHHEPNTRSN